ncbi:MAG: hypothetical protein IKV30_02155 [Clostridia bacterium]|nr:hypothetical protein [Clostridia bacterium]
MRNLTIKRHKSFVGCAVKLKVYIEDPTSNELTISKVSCRKIGELKNGEEKTFQVEEEARKVFVIADKLSKDFCNEYYQLPESSEDIYLSGKPKYNLATSNAFRFDDNDSEEVKLYREKKKGIGIAVLIIAAIVGFGAGFIATSGLFDDLFSKTAYPKTFTSNGLTITLTEAFDEVEMSSYNVVFDSKHVAVFALEEEFSLMAGLEDYTVRQYLELVIQANNQGNISVKYEDGLYSYVYDATNPQTKDTYTYFVYGFKSDDSFWSVQFAVLADEAEEFEEQIIEWAKTIEVE